MSGADYYPAGAYNDPYLNEPEYDTGVCERCGEEHEDDYIYEVDFNEEVDEGEDDLCSKFVCGDCLTDSELEGINEGAKQIGVVYVRSKFGGLIKRKLDSDGTYA